MTDEVKLLPCPTFWVVERFENERSAGYWSGGNSRAFLTDIEKAIHFCRREDAMWTIMGWHWGDVKITEHSYIENTRAPAPREDGWLPIESAPKDGTLILACGFGPKGYFVADVKYKDEQWMIFHPEEDDWTVASHRVTHWRPLQSPPAGKERE